MGALVEKLLVEGHDVLWLVAPVDIDHPEVSRLQKKGATVVLLPAPPRRYFNFATVRRFVDSALSNQVTLSRILGDFSPEHIYVNQGGAWSALADEGLMECLRASRGRYSLIVHLNQPGHVFSSDALAEARGLVSDAKYVFFNSDWVRQLTEIQICKSIPNAIFYQLPLRHYPKQALPWPDGLRPRLAMVNRLDVYHKGIDVALSAIAQLTKEGEGVTLSIYGSGPDESYIREAINFLGLRGAVNLCGHVDAIEKIWRAEELLLLPSRFEGCPVSVLEAMSFGRPVLRTPYGGAAEWVHHGIDGYICPSADAHSLHRTLSEALRGRATWRQIGLAAHENIGRNLSQDPAIAFLASLSV